MSVIVCAVDVCRDAVTRRLVLGLGEGRVVDGFKNGQESGSVRFGVLLDSRVQWVVHDCYGLGWLLDEWRRGEGG